MDRRGVRFELNEQLLRFMHQPAFPTVLLRLSFGVRAQERHVISLADASRLRL